MQGTSTDWRDALLLEHYDPVGKGSVPTFCAIRTAEYTYVRYDPDVEPRHEELYDLVADPFELENLMAGAPSGEILELRDELHARLTALCDPPPPDYGF